MGCQESYGALPWKRKKCYNCQLFTSFGVAKQLRQKETSIVGTVNKIRRELPPSAKTTQYLGVIMEADYLPMHAKNKGLCSCVCWCRFVRKLKPSDRWPVAVFYNIFELVSNIAFVLYKERTKDSISRRDFFKLATELRED